MDRQALNVLKRLGKVPIWLYTVHCLKPVIRHVGEPDNVEQEKWPGPGEFAHVARLRKVVPTSPKQNSSGPGLFSLTGGTHEGQVAESRGGLLSDVNREAGRVD
jgi:hypothetical protein